MATIQRKQQVAITHAEGWSLRGWHNVTFASRQNFRGGTIAPYSIRLAGRASPRISYI